MSGCSRTTPPTNRYRGMKRTCSAEWWRYCAGCDVGRGPPVSGLHDVLGQRAGEIWADPGTKPGAILGVVGRQQLTLGVHPGDQRALGPRNERVDLNLRLRQRVGDP